MIVGKGKANEINTFVKQFTDKNVTKPNLLIIGSNGTGKSMTVEMILRQHGYEVGTVNLENIYIKTGKTKGADLNKTTDICWYLSFSAPKRIMPDGSFRERKMALVCDDASNITKPKNKECLKAIIKLNNEYKFFPIIIIANNKHNKLFTDIRKSLTYPTGKTDPKTGKPEKAANEIKFPKPSDYEMRLLMNHIIKDQKMSIDDDLFDIILDHVHKDIRRFIGVLEELYGVYGKKHITFDMFCTYKDTFESKIVDMGIYHDSSALLNDYEGIQEAMDLFSHDRSNMPLMIHENYAKAIYLKVKGFENQINAISQISESLSISDSIDGLTYSKSCWTLQEGYGFFACVIPPFIISTMPKKSKVRVTTDYTKDFYKTSTKKNNQKLIRFLKTFPNCGKLSTIDFLHMSVIIKELFLRKDTATVAELLKPYQFNTIKDIGTLIKIDKIKEPSCYLQKGGILSTKIKTMMDEGKDVSKYCRLFKLDKKKLAIAINRTKPVDIKYLPTGKQGKIFEAMLGLKPVDSCDE